MTGIAAGAGALTGVALGWWGALAVVTAMTAVLLLAGRERVVVATCVVAMAASAAGAWRATEPRTLADGRPAIDPRDVAMVATAPVASGQRQHFVVAFGPDGDGGGEARRVCVTAAALPVVSIGDVVRLQGEPRAVGDAALAHRAFLASRGCGYSMFAASVVVIDSTPSLARVLSDVRSRLGKSLRSAAPGDAGVLLSGLVTGDDAGFSEARQDAFIRTGTTHLTAVSGSNLALVAGMLAAVGGATVGRHRAAWQIVTVCGVWVYAAISGAEAPALRAAIVASAAIFAFRVGRRPDFVTLVVVAAGAMALIDPGRIGALGFQLSVAASLALALVLPPLMARGRGAGLTVVVAGTAAAQIATLPFLLPIFGTVSLASVPANVVAAPLAALAMPLAGLAGLAGLVWPPLAEPLVAPAVLAANGLIAAVDVLSAPNAYVSVGVPPFPATAAIAVTASALLAALVGTAARGRIPMPPTTRGSAEEPPLAEGRALAAPAARIIARENPPHTLGAYLDHAKENPASEKQRHDLTN